LPWLVFTTGFEEYALAAHQVRPFGYLVKPLNDANVAIVLDKIRKVEHHKALKQPQHRIEIRHRAMNRGETIWRTKYVCPDEILYIQTNNDNTVKVKLMQGEILDGIHLPLSRWQVDYELPDFMQAHKNHLVNLKQVNGLKPDPFRVDGYSVTFRSCDTELAVGRSFLDDLRKALGK
jgi:two-component system, LytTR family, response regulator